MCEEEIVIPNDTTRMIRTVIHHLETFRDGKYDVIDQRHLAMVLTKLEEAELLSFRIIDRKQND